MRDDDWIGKPLTIVIVPGLSGVSLQEILPALFTLFQTNIKTDMEIWAIDTDDITTQDFHEQYVRPHVQRRNENIPLEGFLQCVVYKKTPHLDDWRTLTQLLQLTAEPDHNVAIWLAADRDEQSSVLAETVYTASKRITPSILQGWSRVMIEAPVPQFDKSIWREVNQVYRLHPLLATRAVEQILSFRQREWTNSIWNSQAIQSVYISVQTKSSVYSILAQVFHVLAVVTMEIPIDGDKIAIQDARLLALQKMSPYFRPQDLLLGSRNVACDDDHVKGDTNEPTFICIRCWIGSKRWANTPFFLRVQTNDTNSSAREDTFRVSMRLRDDTHNDSFVFEDTCAQFSMSSTSKESLRAIDMNLVDSTKTGHTGRARLALEMFQGKQSMFVSGSELDTIHTIIHPLVKQCATTKREKYGAEEEPLGLASFLCDTRPPTFIESASAPISPKNPMLQYLSSLSLRNR